MHESAICYIFIQTYMSSNWLCYNDVTKQNSCKCIVSRKLLYKNHVCIPTMYNHFNGKTPKTIPTFKRLKCFQGELYKYTI